MRRGPSPEWQAFLTALHEKGGKIYEIVELHKSQDNLNVYPNFAGIRCAPKSPLLRTTRAGHAY
jgi:hypothetical protein